MDFFDPSVVPGVGTPEPGGALWEDAAGIIDFVRRQRTIVGFDIVELCPPREKKKSLAAALGVLFTVLRGACRAAVLSD
jgi:agmatinase